MGKVTQLEGGSQSEGSTEVLLNGLAEVINMEEDSILLGESNEEKAGEQKEKRELEARALIKEAERERELMAQFEEIRRLCGGETDFNKSPVYDAALKKLTGFTQSLSNGKTSTSASTDKVYFFISQIFLRLQNSSQVDSGGGKGSICIEVLKTLIRRLDTEKNPANVITIGGFG